MSRGLSTKGNTVYWVTTPTDSVFSDGLFTRARISGDIIHGKGATGTASPDRLVLARPKSEQR
eukprot:2140341-Pleurochrysis_carterae.AAC.1